MSQEESRRTDAPEEWELWVPRFLEQRYSLKPPTYRAYLNYWRNISAFLAARRIDVPRQLTRPVVRDYVAWRADPHDAVYRGCKNTALTELALLGVIMREAVQSGFATLNPCDKLGIPRDRARRKPRITPEEHETILRALETRPAWMQVCYAIGWEQGCRLSETHLHLATQLDLGRGIIRFRTKGHKDTLAEFPLSPKLVPMFRRMLSEGREFSYDMPSSPGTIWWRFFRQIALPHLCFHSVRVSFVTRCLEAGLTREQTMRLTGHADFASHQIYARLSSDHSTVRQTRRMLDDAAASRNAARNPSAESGQRQGAAPAG